MNNLLSGLNVAQSTTTALRFAAAPSKHAYEANFNNRFAEIQKLIGQGTVTRNTTDSAGKTLITLKTGTNDEFALEEWAPGNLLGKSNKNYNKVIYFSTPELSPANGRKIPEGYNVFIGYNTPNQPSEVLISDRHLGTALSSNPQTLSNVSQLVNQVLTTVLTKS